MAENQNGQDKSEQPTSKRQAESRKKGQVARSKELGTLMVVSGALMFIWLTSEALMSSLFAFMNNALAPSGELLSNPDLISSHLVDSIVSGLLIVMPLLLVTVVLALVGPALMGGVVFSFEALAFKAEKLDPVKGLGKMFSTKSLIELVKALLKFLLIVGIATYLFFLTQKQILTLGRLEVVEGILKSGSYIIWLAFLTSLSLAIIAAIDVPYQVWSHNKELKMTMQEVKDESKETDGRPEVKSRIRQLQREASQRRMLEDIPTADVVITNPTHYSIALKYDPSGVSAPLVVAKGADLIALKIRTIASENNVLIYEEPPLARAIFGSTEIGDEIPAPLFLAVAKVLAYVFHLKKAGPTDYVPRPDAVPLPEDYMKFYEEGL
ncbi:flagellar biosynthesis protein FlhB [Luminiphilus sp.]|nr:flagellar biosynthesis protein FlhB [Luminiphilus sp.]MDC3316550.1 flagellar biosynthesis protein FlhB [bacterium]